MGAAVDLLHRVLHRERATKPGAPVEPMMGEILRPLGPLVCVVGARPNYMKMAPLLRAFARASRLARRRARAHRPALRRRR